MKKSIEVAVKKVLGVIVAGCMIVSPMYSVVARAAYVEGVHISEDAYETLSKGTTTYNGVNYATVDGYNPVYYYLNYADLRESIGADPEGLVRHWAEHGRTSQERRVSNKLTVREAQTGSSSYEYIVPSYQKTSKQQDGMVVIPGELHSNGGMTRNQEDQARSIAKQIAQHVYTQATTKGKGTQIEMVAYATGIVKAYCDLGTYTTEGKIYRTAYGVFIGHEYSCAGATRAMGLVIDYLDALCQNHNAEVEAAKKAAEEAKKAAEAAKASGSTSSTTTTTTTSTTTSTTNSTIYPPLKWVHVNANKWDDQWCQIVCDNHEAYSDPTKAIAGYGKHPNQGGKKQDYQTYVKFATESDVITTIPQYVDGQDPVYMNRQYNKVN